MQNSHSTSVPAITGDVYNATKRMFRQHKAYRILIFGDEAERTRALTLITAMPSVLVVINTGEEMEEKTTSSSRKNSSVKPATETLSSAPSSTARRTTS